MTKSLTTFLELLLFFALILTASFLALGSSLNKAVLGGINLYVTNVLPSVFPYFFITAVLSSLRVTSRLTVKLSPLSERLFNVNGNACYAFFMSVISGYPIGAKIVSDLKINGLLSDAESVRASAFCSTSSPTFMISVIGAITFNSTIFGIALFCCHLTCAILVGIIFSFYKRKDKCISFTPIAVKNVDNVLYESVYSAVISTLVVGGLITLFYLLTEILLSINLLTPIIDLLNAVIKNETVARSIVIGFFECTRGIKTLSAVQTAQISLPVCAFLCGFGGLSIIVQSIAYLKKAKIKTAPFLLAKALCAVLNFIVAFIVSLFIF